MAVKIYNVGVSNIRVREQGVFTAPELVTDAGLYIESAGGYYAGGNIIVGSKEYAIIIAPKELGESESIFTYTQTTPTVGALSTYNGKENTDKYITVTTTYGFLIADFCTNLNINGLNDWHVPSPDEVEICYRFLKPTTQDNYTSSSSLHSEANGFNPNSNPMSTGYTLTSPEQTINNNFKEGGSQSFDINTPYWTSMEYQSNAIRTQNFYSGSPAATVKSNQGTVRAVRWLEV